MQTLPTKASSVSLPAPLAPHLDRDLRLAIGHLDPMIEPGRSGYTIAAANAPTADLRRSLEIRRQRIDEWMLPAGPERATEEYRIMARVMAHKDRGEKGADEHVVIFVKDTMSLPLFALVGSCQAFRTGQVGDGEWMPEPGLVCAEARRRITALAKERREIDAVLTAKIRAPITTSEHRRAVLAGLQPKLKGIREAGLKADQERQSKEAAFRLEEAKAEAERLLRESRHLDALIHDGKSYDRPLPKLSPELYSKYMVATAQPREAAE